MTVVERAPAPAAATALSNWNDLWMHLLGLGRQAERLELESEATAMMLSPLVRRRTVTLLRVVREEGFAMALGHSLQSSRPLVRPFD